MVVSGDCTLAEFTADTRTLLQELPEDILRGVRRHSGSLALHACIVRRVLARVFHHKQDWAHNKFGLVSYMLRDALDTFSHVDRTWGLVSTDGQDERKVQVVCIREQPKTIVTQTAVSHGLPRRANVFATSLVHTRTTLEGFVHSNARLSYYTLYSMSQWAWDEMVYALTLEHPEHFPHTTMEYYDSHNHTHNLLLACQSDMLHVLSLASQVRVWP